MMESSVLKGYRCPKCAWVDFSETKTCPRCRAEVQGRSLSGKGSVATFTVIRYPPEGFEAETPYVVALVDLEDGLRVIGRVKAKPDELQISESVHFVREAGGVLHFEVG